MSFRNESIVRRLRNIAAAGLLPIALLSLAPAASADDGPWRPFRASVDVSETMTLNPLRCAATMALGETTGKGHATHMGRIALLATDCPVFVPGSPVIPVIDGRMEITAANGDKLFGVYNGSLTMVSATDANLNAAYSITGGTGRFAGASGSGQLSGQYNVGTNQGHYDAVGHLRY